MAPVAPSPGAKPFDAHLSKTGHRGEPVTGITNDNRNYYMKENIILDEAQEFAADLKEISDRWPEIHFEDRNNLPAKKGERARRPLLPLVILKVSRQRVYLDFLRFQAFIPVLEKVEEPAIPRKREAISAIVPKRWLLACADTPKRLGEILSKKWGSR